MYLEMPQDVCCRWLNMPRHMFFNCNKVDQVFFPACLLLYSYKRPWVNNWTVYFLAMYMYVESLPLPPTLPSPQNKISAICTCYNFYTCYNYLVLTLKSTVTAGCLRALYMGENDLTVFPPHIEKFVHLEVVNCMNGTLEHDHTHMYTACTLEHDHTHVHTTCTLERNHTALPSSVMTAFTFKCDHTHA